MFLFHLFLNIFEAVRDILVLVTIFSCIDSYLVRLGAQRWARAFIYISYLCMRAAKGSGETVRIRRLV